MTRSAGHITSMNVPTKPLLIIIINIADIADIIIIINIAQQTAITECTDYCISRLSVVQTHSNSSAYVNAQMNNLAVTFPTRT